MKLPVICALPPGIPLGSTIRGADCTTPSSTIATALQPDGGWQLGMSGCLAAFAVTFSHSSAPRCLKLRSTRHSLLCGSIVASALEISEPATAVGASRYL